MDLALATRRLRYEIETLKAGRWEIISVVDDGRDDMKRAFDRTDLEKLEQRVRALAHSYLTVPEVTAVRVRRERIRSDGFRTETEVLNLISPPRDDTRKSLSLGTVRGEVALCGSADDFLSRSACRTIGSALRSVLDDLDASAIDVLVDDAWTRRLEPHETIIRSALHAIAGLQAGTGDRRARVAELDKLLENARRRVSAALGERNLPTLDDGGLDKLLARVEARMADADRRFFTLRILSKRLRDFSGGFGRLEFLLSLLQPGLSPAATSLLDELIAAQLDSPVTIKEILGEVHDLGTALIILVALSSGQSMVAGETAELVATLASGIMDGKLPHAAEALLDRLISGLAGSRRLTKDGLDTEWRMLEHLETVVMGSSLKSRHEAILKAIDTRRRDLRRQVLDA
ncbi:MAG TPA: hypothetical protein VNT30_25590 [Stellaceae bacterium]|nr:hypothetical protein [Stellaceae bacterium]